MGPLHIVTKFGKEIPSRDLQEKRSASGSLCDPPRNPSPHPTLEGCVSSRKQWSFEVRGGGGIQEGRGQWGGGKTAAGEKDAQKAVTNQEPLNAPFLNGLFSSGFSRGKTPPQDDIGETPH